MGGNETEVITAKLNEQNLDCVSDNNVFSAELMRVASRKTKRLTVTLLVSHLVAGSRKECQRTLALR